MITCECIIQNILISIVSTDIKWYLYIIINLRIQIIIFKYFKYLYYILDK